MSELFFEHLQPLVGIIGLTSGAASGQANEEFERVKRDLADVIVSRNARFQGLPTVAPLRKITSLPGHLVDNAALLSTVKDLPLVKYSILSQDYMLPHSKPSILSPDNSSSPLYPRGLMHVDWLRRYCKHVPGVLIYVCNLPSLNISGNPLDPSTATDYMFSQDIIKMRNQILGDHLSDIKFVVLIVSSSTNPFSEMETRIAFIRKSCNVDDKPSIHFLTLESRENVSEFIIEQEKLIHESSLNFYKEMGKKFKKKKGKTGQTGFKPTSKLTALEWNIRYDYKMATFAELMQDFDLSLRHFVTSYNSMMDYFKDIRNKEALFSASRHKDDEWVRAFSKQWNENMDFFDSISFKISKYLLYSNSPVDGLFQLNRHINFVKFLYISLGESNQSERLWMWISRQYTVFADLVSSYHNLGLVIPEFVNGKDTHADSSYIVSDIASSLAFDCSLMASTGSFKNQDVIVGLLHAGFYYLMAAKCIMSINLTPQRSDLQNLIIERLTKSYEFFKKFRHSRSAFYVAFIIGRSYMHLKKYDMALKFFDRISRSYRRETCAHILANVLEYSLECSRETKNQFYYIANYLELLNADVTPDVNERQTKWSLFQKSIPQSSGDLCIDSEQFLCFLNLSAGFKFNRTRIGAKIPFQIVISGNDARFDIALIGISVKFTNPEFNFEIKHSDGLSPFISGDRTICRSQDEGKANLAFSTDSLILEHHDLLAHKEQELKVFEIVLKFEHFSILYKNTSYGSARRNSKSFKQTPFLYPYIQIVRLKAKVELDVEVEKIAVIGEELSVKVVAKNKENRVITALVFMKNIEDDYVDAISTNDSTNGIPIRNLSFDQSGTILLKYKVAPTNLKPRKLLVILRCFDCDETDFSKGYSEVSKQIHIEVLDPFNVSLRRFGKKSLLNIANTSSLVLSPLNIKLNPNESLNMFIDATESIKSELLLRRGESEFPYLYEVSNVFENEFLRIQVNYPRSNIRLHESITVEYIIESRLREILDLEVETEICEYLVYSGYKSVTVRLFPLEHTSVFFVCCPLQSGKIRLPNLKVQRKYETEITTIEILTATTIHVLPQ